MNTRNSWTSRNTESSFLESSGLYRRLLRVVVGSLILAAQVFIAQPSLANAETDSAGDGIYATLQRQSAVSDDDLVMIDDVAVHAQPYYIRVNGRSTAEVFSLDARQQPSFDSRWSTVDPTATPGIPGLASAYWIVNNQDSLGQRLASDTLELAARQVAIWAAGETMSISPQTVPNEVIRDRANEIVRLAPAQVTIDEPVITDVRLSMFVVRADADTVTVNISTLPNGQNTFDHPLKIDLRVLGRWGTVETGELSKINQIAAGDNLIVTNTGAAPDKNTALVELTRTNDVTQIEAHFSLTLPPGSVMLPGQGPALITINDMDADFVQEVALDPATFPSAQDLLDRLGLGLLGSLPGPWGFILLALFVYLVAKLTPAADRLFAFIWRRLFAPVLRRSTNSGQGPQSGQGSSPSGTAGSSGSGP